MWRSYKQLFKMHLRVGTHLHSVFHALPFLFPLVTKLLFFPKSLPIFIILAIIKRRKNKVLKYLIETLTSVNIDSPIFCYFLISSVTK